MQGKAILPPFSERDGDREKIRSLEAEVRSLRGRLNDERARREEAEKVSRCVNEAAKEKVREKDAEIERLKTELAAANEQKARIEEAYLDSTIYSK